MGQLFFSKIPKMKMFLVSKKRIFSKIGAHFFHEFSPKNALFLRLKCKNDEKSMFLAGFSQKKQVFFFVETWPGGRCWGYVHFPAHSIPICYKETAEHTEHARHARALRARNRRNRRKSRFFRFFHLFCLFLRV